MEIYKIIRKTRQSKKETQRDIAQLFQTTQEQISKYENGKQEIPTYRIVQLCRHWNISADYILGLPKNLPYPETGIDTGDMADEQE